MIDVGLCPFCSKSRVGPKWAIVAEPRPNSAGRVHSSQKSHVGAQPQTRSFCARVQKVEEKARCSLMVFRLNTLFQPKSKYTLKQKVKSLDLFVGFGCGLGSMIPFAQIAGLPIAPPQIFEEPIDHS